MNFAKFVFEDIYILDRGPDSVICCQRSYFDKDLISRIHSTSKSMKIVVQQILMKPDYMTIFFYLLLLVHHFIVLICCLRNK